MESSKEKKVRTNARGTKVVRVTKPDGSRIVKRIRASGKTSTRRINAEGDVRRITKTNRGETTSYGRRSSTIKAANKIAKARQAEQTKGIKATGTAGRIARLQAKRKAADKSGKTAKKSRIKSRIQTAKSNLQQKILERIKARKK